MSILTGSQLDECKQDTFEFHGLFQRKVKAFTAGRSPPMGVRFRATMTRPAGTGRAAEKAVPGWAIMKIRTGGGEHPSSWNSDDPIHGSGRFFHGYCSQEQLAGHGRRRLDRHTASAIN